MSTVPLLPQRKRLSHLRVQVHPLFQNRATSTLASKARERCRVWAAGLVAQPEFWDDRQEHLAARQELLASHVRLLQLIVAEFHKESLQRPLPHLRFTLLFRPGSYLLLPQTTRALAYVAVELRNTIRNNLKNYKATCLGCLMMLRGGVPKAQFQNLNLA